MGHDALARYIWGVDSIEEIYISGYRSGFYHDPVIGGFNDAFCQLYRKIKK